MTKLTKIEVIDETVEYYRTHNRAIDIVDDKPLCCYYSTTGDMCAVGRCLLPDNQNVEFSDKYAGMGVYALPYINDIMQDKYRHITDKYFWTDLQNLHDDDKSWIKNDTSVDINSLTERGKHRVQEMKDMYNDNQ